MELIDVISSSIAPSILEKLDFRLIRVVVEVLVRHNLIFEQPFFEQVSPSSLQRNISFPHKTYSNHTPNSQSLAMPKIIVIGSLNVDMVTTTSRVPEAGETLQATSFEVGWGGKGANQAVAAAKLGDSSTKVYMYGAVGDDVFGPQLIKGLRSDGVDNDGVKSLEGEKTGTAVILVEEESGENRILFTPGANHKLKVDDDLVPGGEYGDIAVFQLELPLDVVTHHIEKARSSGAVVIFNPAPAIELPESLFSKITHLIINETEAAILSGLPRDSISSTSDLDSISTAFIEKGVSSVIITLGAEGVYYQTSTHVREKISGKRIPAAKAKVVDTTAAGDTFVGGFAVEIARALDVPGKDGLDDQQKVVDKAVAFAIRASGKTVEKAGAQKSIPSRSEVLNQGTETATVERTSSGHSQDE
ncbi:Ribokinase-like protein [Tothia fuscella]|uniref:Ribokinase n=1 Tax=Tothia fuscella TaxID=1048955 RepID=A0A9P4NIB1_9PEZI|nr:Ribokinase-like protein [Tothia fuscella]